MMNGHLQSINSFEMEICFHLEDAGWILKVSLYLNLEKGMELCKHCQVSGDFCVEQNVFL